MIKACMKIAAVHRCIRRGFEILFLAMPSGIFETSPPEVNKVSRNVFLRLRQECDRNAGFLLANEDTGLWLSQGVVAGH